MKQYLKIKTKTLAAESRYIKLERKRALAAWRHNRDNTGAETRVRGMDNHRKFMVKPMARATCLAYGFLRGRSYEQMEPIRYSSPDWKVVESMVMRYSMMEERETRQKFAEFKAQYDDKPLAKKAA